jgi:hypothetical protein
VPAVTDKRNALGLPPFAARSRRWSHHELALLGKLPDTEVARRLGRSLKAVQFKRNLLHLRPANDRRPPHQWTRREERLLGTKPDEEVARLLDLTTTIVTGHRGRTGIPLLWDRQRHWTRAEEKLLGTASDAIIARRLGCHHSTVAGQRRKLGIPSTIHNWTPKKDKPIDTMPDRQLTHHLGRSLLFVRNRRLKLHIPPAPNPKHRPWTGADLRLLGTIPDADLTRRTSRTYQARRAA